MGRTHAADGEESLDPIVIHGSKYLGLLKWNGAARYIASRHKIAAGRDS